MLAIVVMFAMNNVFIKVAVAELAPLPFVVARFSIVLVLVWAWIAWRRIPARIAASDVPTLILGGVSGFAIVNTFVTIGMTRTSAFSVALLMNLSPVFTLMIARLLGLERPNPAQWLSVAIALTGVFIFIGGSLPETDTERAIVGDILALIAAFAFAIYSFVARPIVVRYGAMVNTGWSVSIGMVAIAPWGFPASLEQSWSTLSPAVWGTLFYAGAIAMLAGYTLWSWAVARAGVSRTAPYLFLVPVGTGIISALFLGEEFTAGKLAGAALVLTGTAGVRLLGERMTGGGRRKTEGGSERKVTDDLRDPA